MAKKTKYTKEDIEIIVKELLKKDQTGVSEISRQTGYSYSLVYGVERHIRALTEKGKIDTVTLSIGEEVKEWIEEIVRVEQNRIKDPDIELGEELSAFLETIEDVQPYSRAQISMLLKSDSIEEVMRKTGKTEEELETIMRVDALIDIAKRYRAQNNYSGLKEVLKEILDFEPQNTFALNASAKIDLEEGQTENGTITQKTIPEIFYKSMGIVYTEIGKENPDTERICEAIKIAYQANPKMNGRPLMRRLVEQGKFDIMNRINESILEIDPNNYMAAKNSAREIMRKMEPIIPETQIEKYLSEVSLLKMGEFYRMLKEEGNVRKVIKAIRKDSAGISIKTSLTEKKTEAEQSNKPELRKPSTKPTIIDALYAGKIQEKNLEGIFQNLEGLRGRIRYIEICAHLGRRDLINQIIIKVRKLPNGNEKRILNTALGIVQSERPRDVISRKARFGLLCSNISGEKDPIREESVRE